MTTPEIAELYNDIGNEAVELAGDPRARILVYSEIKPGVQGMIFRYLPRGGSSVKQGGDTRDLEEAVYRLWHNIRENDPANLWSAIVYTVDDGKVHARLLYGDQVDFKQPLWEKSVALLEEYFPGLPLEPAGAGRG